MGDKKNEFEETVTLDAKGTPTNGHYKWTSSKNNGYCKEEINGDKLKLTSEKPGMFNVEVTYTKDGKSDTAISEIVVPYELQAFFKTEFDMQSESEAIKRNGGAALDYVVLQGNNDNPSHYDFKFHNAMTYIQVWMEEYDDDHKQHGETKFKLKCDPDCLNFYKSEDGTQGCTHLKIDELTRIQSGTDIKGIRVYLSAKGVKYEKKEVKILLELDNGKGSYKDIDKGRIYLNNAVEDRQGSVKYGVSVKRDIEHMDKFLIKSVLDETKDLYVFSKKFRNKSIVAIAQACLPKCGKKTIINAGNIIKNMGNKKLHASAIKAYTNIPIDAMEKAQAMIWKTGSNDRLLGTEDLPDGTRGNGIPRDDFDNLKDEYFRLLKENAKQSIHPIIKKLILSRINDIQSGKPYIVGNKAPGYHAEVLSVNQVLNEYFPAVKNKSILNKITVATGMIQGWKGEEGKLPYFEACDNCKAILSSDGGKSRIITDEKLVGSKKDRKMFEDYK